MLVRIRWFLVGVLSSIGVIAYLAKQIRRARETLSPRNVARAGMRSVADALDTAAERIEPPGGRRR